MPAGSVSGLEQTDEGVFTSRTLGELCIPFVHLNGCMFSIQQIYPKIPLPTHTRMRGKEIELRHIRDREQSGVCMSPAWAVLEKSTKTSSKVCLKHKISNNFECSPQGSTFLPPRIKGNTPWAAALCLKNPTKLITLAAGGEDGREQEGPRVETRGES